MLKKSLSPKKPLAVLKIAYLSLSTIISLLFSAQVLAQTDTSLFVPIILSSSGENGSFFTSELALTNRGNTNVSLDYRYTAAFGGGSGVASDSLPAGQQRIIPDAIDYLKSLGVPIPDSGNRGGTLAVQVHNLASSRDFDITARTTTTVPDGRAGLAYSAVRPLETRLGPAYLFGLRQNETDRSNVAVQNMGEDNIRLRLTVYSGDPSHPVQQTLPEITLFPGGWYQYPEILHSNGLSLSNGFVRIEQVSGASPYYAYAVINDQASSDGSWISPIPEPSFRARPGFVLPAIIENDFYSSELIAANASSYPKTLALSYVADAVQNATSTVDFSLTLDPGEQVILSDLVQYLRDVKGAAPILPAGLSYAGPLFVTVVQDAPGIDAYGLYLAARTSTSKGGRGYSVFYQASPMLAAPSSDVWIYGLRRDSENRTNLALVNTGEMDESSDIFDVELFEGATGRKVNTIRGITLAARKWLQIGNILAQSDPKGSQGYAHVIRKAGANPFIAYAVVNDGENPGERSGDGTYIPSSSGGVAGSGFIPKLEIRLTNLPPDHQFCFGAAGVLTLRDGPPNESVTFFNAPPGFNTSPDDMTDSQGNFSMNFLIPHIGISVYHFTFWASVGAIRSNSLSITTFDCD